jgi:hypothetical protein
MLIGGLSVVAGLSAARQWALAPGGTIVLMAVAAFAVAVGWSSARTALAGRRTGAELRASGHRSQHGHGHDHGPAQRGGPIAGPEPARGIVPDSR